MTVAAVKDQAQDNPALESGLDYSLDIFNLSKKFKRKTVRSGYTTIKSSLLDIVFRRKRAEGSYTQAISDLTLRIPRGASVGIIGRNGSGKSTLLKLITGIYKPNTGWVKVNGRLAALIELGAGFHPDFTGRENLYLGGIMHGLTRAQIDQRFDQIVEFSELADVIDDPVRTYSSGMFMRLGFSLAVHTDPDILLVDEVLAVGDAAFVAKCKGKIAELRKNQKTLLLVTHDLEAVERWCDEVLWLDNGQVKDRGYPRRVIDHYREFVEKGEETELFENERVDPELDNPALVSESIKEVLRWGSREIEITSVQLLGQGTQEKLLFHPSESFRVKIGYRINQAVDKLVFGIGINRTDGLVVYGTNTDIERIEIPPLKMSGQITFEAKRISLLDGAYTIDVAVHRQDGYPYDYHKGIIKFVVRNPVNQVGVVALEHQWGFGS